MSWFSRERTSRPSSSLSRFLQMLGWMLAAWFCAAGLAHAADAVPDWRIGPVPRWVNALEAPQDPSFASAHPEAGLAYEEIDSQRRIVRGEDWAYTRVKVRVVSEAGAEAAGQQSFDFSPPNERLMLHSIRVHRDGEAISRLRAEAVQLLQREANLDELVYDNKRTAFLVIPDLRVGDVLEYDWSIVGANPALGDHIGLGLSTHRSVAAGVASSRILVDRALNVRGFGGAQVPAPVRIGGLYEYSIREDSVPAVPFVENVPTEAQLTAWVQFSDFADWESVARWGTDLFTLWDASAPAVSAVALELGMDQATDTARTLAVLRWVQAEVRYFSRPFAQSTHRPAQPTTVLERRYGDCKDKALLTVALLTEVGIHAHVALVDSDEGRLIPELLPTLSAFDHAIVVAYPNGERVWLDPTATYQRGSLDDFAARGLHWALPLTAGTHALVPVETPPTERPHMKVHASYDATSYDDPATLKLRVEFTQGFAESYRYLHETKDPDAFAKVFEEGFESDLRQLHPDAESLDALVYEDHEMNNRVVLRRSYSIPSFWVSGEGKLETHVDPFSLYGELPTPEAGRTAPLGVDYPRRLEHHVTLDLPSDFEVDQKPTHVEEGPVRYSLTTKGSGSRVELDWTLTTTKHRLEPSEFEAYDAAVATVNESFSYYLWETTPALAEDATFNWSIFMAGVMWASILLGAMLWVFKRGPHLPANGVGYDPSLIGLSGWLALVGFSLVVGIPKLLLSEYQTLSAYSNESWAILTSPTSADYDPMWAPLLLFELFTNLFLLAATVATAIAYFKKHRSFALLFVLMHTSAVVLLTLDDALTWRVTGESVSSAAEVGMRWIRGAAWVAYGLRSVRVRSTFLPAPPDFEAFDGPMRFAPRPTSLDKDRKV